MTSVGKRVVYDLYVHISAIAKLADRAQRERIDRALALLPESSDPPPNVAKLDLRTGRLSLLSYPGFEEQAFPELAASWTFADAENSGPVYRSYANSLNRPILHRKELLVADDYPARRAWVDLTATAESLGLFDDTTAIGFRLNWERLIRSKGYACVDDQFQPLPVVSCRSWSLMTTCRSQQKRQSTSCLPLTTSMAS